MIVDCRAYGPLQEVRVRRERAIYLFICERKRQNDEKTEFRARMEVRLTEGYRLQVNTCLCSATC